MDSATATPQPSTRVVLTRIPDSWAWMRPDLLVRLMPFAIAFAVAYAWSGGGGGVGVGPWDLGVERVFSAGGGATGFWAAGGGRVGLWRRRGTPLRPPRGGAGGC